MLPVLLEGVAKVKTFVTQLIAVEESNADSNTSRLSRACEASRYNYWYDYCWTWCFSFEIWTITLFLSLPFSFFCYFLSHIPLSLPSLPSLPLSFVPSLSLPYLSSLSLPSLPLSLFPLSLSLPSLPPSLPPLSPLSLPLLSPTSPFSPPLSLPFPSPPSIPWLINPRSLQYGLPSTCGISCWWAVEETH